MQAADQVVTLRGLRGSDAAALARLSRDCFGEYDRAAERRGQALANRSDAFSRCVEQGGMLIGFAVLSLRDGHAWLDAIAVAAGYRARGIGRMLLGSVEREARRRGASRIGLATADSNLAALDLFKRQGFCIRERKPRYYDRGQDAVIMTKAL